MGHVHIFHNCKRLTLGHAAARRKEWLLDVGFRKRETFAYSCVAYARIIVRAMNPKHRLALATEYVADVRVTAVRVAPADRSPAP